MKQFESFDTNLRDEAQDLLLLQYQNDPQFTQWIDELIKPLENLKRILLDFNRIFDIDKAEGFWLDKIGKLFCVPRRFCVDRLGVQVCSMLDDIDYRKFIKARIAKNYSKATAEDIILAVSNILGHNKFYLHEQPDNEPMTLGLVFGASISQFDMDLFSSKNIAPKPSGVRYSNIRALSSGKAFVFDDTSVHALETGSFDDTTIDFAGEFIS